MAKIQIGIIGTGGMANAHAQAFNQIPGCNVTTCHDVLPKLAAAFAKNHNINHIAKNLDDLLDNCNAVCVVTPDRYHAPISLAVLKRGHHLLCEKPLTLNLPDAKKVARAAQRAHDKHNTIHMVNFSYRRSAALQHAIKLITRGDLGEIIHVNSRYMQSWLVSKAWGDWRTKPGWLWRLQTKAGSGGVLGDVGCHILDFTTAIAGDLSSLRCNLKTFPKFNDSGKPVTNWKGGQLDANDTAIIEMNFQNGAIGVLQTTRWATGHANTVAIDVHGSNGAIRINLDDSYETIDLCLGQSGTT